MDIEKGVAFLLAFTGSPERNPPIHIVKLTPVRWEHQHFHGLRGEARRLTVNTISDSLENRFPDFFFEREIIVNAWLIICYDTFFFSINKLTNSIFSVCPCKYREKSVKQKIYEKKAQYWPMNRIIWNSFIWNKMIWNKIIWNKVITFAAKLQKRHGLTICLRKISKRRILHR